MKFLACRYTGLMPAFFQNLLKAVPSVRVNDIKVNWRNALIDNIFEIESEKELSKDKRTIF